MEGSVLSARVIVAVRPTGERRGHDVKLARRPSPLEPFEMFDYEPYLRKTPTVGREDSVKDSERQEFLRFAAEFDAPAFIRRAQATTAATEGLFERCEAARDEMLALPKTKLAMLAAVIDRKWSTLTPSLFAGTEAESTGATRWTAEYLESLYDQWKPTLRVHVESSESPRLVKKAVSELEIAFQRFNKRWQQHIDALDLVPVNQIRTDYNNYYVVEKACAFDSERIGRDGFEPLEPITREQILERVPLL